jgi:choline dehydrogenase-like flavoprotein
MIIHGKDIDDNRVLRADYCVVGSGMGGSAVAMRLARAGKDVLLIEAGHSEPVPNGATASVTAERIGRPFAIPVSRNIELGGTSNAWHGICAPLDEIDFEPRPWLGESGWPIRRADLEPFYVEAARIFGHEHLAGLQPDLLPSAVQHELRGIEFDHSVLQPKLLEYRTPPFRWKEILLNFAKADRLRCLLNTTALELVPSEKGSRIAQLKAAAMPGRTIRIEANVYIIAAGALETPRLLLNSRSRSPNGVGNGHDLVGRFLMDHPTGPSSMLHFRFPVRASAYSGLLLSEDGDRHKRHLITALSLCEHRQKTSTVPNHYFLIRPCVAGGHIDTDLRLSFLSVQSVRDLTRHHLAGILTTPNLLYRILTTRYHMPAWYRYGELFFFAEQLPERDSRITLSDKARDAYGYPIASINWLPGAKNIELFAHFLNVVREKGLNADQYQFSIEGSFHDWIEQFTSAAHHLGTARMSDSPSTGVVNANLQVFGVDNLYVCDGSVFTTSGNANPSLTITALALRLAHRLLHPRA